MLIEQLIFIIIAFALFVYMFYQLIKKNDTKYVPILAIEAVGIGIDFVRLYFADGDIGAVARIIIYTFSIVIPILVIVLERLNSNMSEKINIFIAKVYLVFGDTKSAKNKLLEIVTEYPESYLGHKLLAQIYEKEGGQRKAVDEYTQAIEINKKDYDSYYKVSNLLIDLDKKEEATQLLTNLLSKKPDYVEASITLGDLLIEQENYKEAVNIYLDALKYSPTSYDLNYNLGIAYTMLNDFQNAKTSYEKAAELNTLVYNTKYSLAEIAMIYKELDEAEEYFLQTIEDEELCADAYLELAKICILKNEKEQAIKYANVAIQEEPKRIVEKIQKDVTFAIIISKLSIPFNLEIEGEEERKHKLTQKELNAKEHLEQMVEITKKIGYNDLKSERKNEQDKTSQINFHKEREE